MVLNFWQGGRENYAVLQAFINKLINKVQRCSCSGGEDFFVYAGSLLPEKAGVRQLQGSGG